MISIDDLPKPLPNPNESGSGQKTGQKRQPKVIPEWPRHHTAPVPFDFENPEDKILPKQEAAPKSRPPLLGPSIRDDYISPIDVKTKLIFPDTKDWVESSLKLENSIGDLVVIKTPELITETDIIKSYKDKSFATMGFDWDEENQVYVRQSGEPPYSNFNKSGITRDMGLRKEFVVSEEYQKTLQNRARSKHLTQRLTGALATLDNDFFQSYMNSYMCGSVIEQRGVEFSARYCKNRWCVVCNRVKTAKLMNGYLPQLDMLKDAQFVTLTQRNCNADSLHDMMRHQQEFMSTYTTSRRQAYKRNQLPKFVALRKFECTVNPYTHEYHPHYHIIVEGEESADHLRRAWQRYYNSLGGYYELYYSDSDVPQQLPMDMRVNDKAQEVKPISGEGAFKELFKYFTKIVAKDNKYQMIEGEAKVAIDVRPLDTIFHAVKGLRIFQPINIEAVPEKKNDIITEIDYDAVFNHDQWRWVDILNDWVNDKKQKLSGYTKNMNIEDIHFTVTN